MKYRVLSAGQCGYDNSNLRSYFATEFNADVTAVDDIAELTAELARAKYDLVLVNRIFDQGGESGLTAISQVTQASSPAPIMLVSNYHEYQQKAVQAGALEGFGKAELQLPTTRAKIEAALDVSSQE